MIVTGSQSVKAIPGTLFSTFLEPAFKQKPCVCYTSLVLRYIFPLHFSIFQFQKSRWVSNIMITSNVHFFFPGNLGCWVSTNWWHLQANLFSYPSRKYGFLLSAAQPIELSSNWISSAVPRVCWKNAVGMCANRCVLVKGKSIWETLPIIFPSYRDSQHEHHRIKDWEVPRLTVSPTKTCLYLFKSMFPRT